MRSFAGRDILSLKEFERQEFFRVSKSPSGWSRSRGIARTAIY